MKIIRFKVNDCLNYLYLIFLIKKNLFMGNSNILMSIAFEILLTLIIIEDLNQF